MGLKGISVIGILLFSVLLLSGCTGTDESAEKIFKKTELSFSDKPLLNKEVDVIFSVTAPDYPEESWNETLSGYGEYNKTVVADILLSDGFELVRGDNTWEGYLGPGQSISNNITVKAVKEGKWSIMALAGTSSRRSFDSEYRYFHVTQIDTFVSDAPLPCFGEECTKISARREI